MISAVKIGKSEKLRLFLYYYFPQNASAYLYCGLVVGFSNFCYKGDGFVVSYVVLPLRLWPWEPLCGSG